MNGFFEHVLERQERKRAFVTAAELGYPDNFWIFGLKSLGHEVHKEATRICCAIELEDIVLIREHLVDLGVYAMLFYNYLEQFRGEEGGG